MLPEAEERNKKEENDKEGEYIRKTWNMAEEMTSGMSLQLDQVHNLSRTHRAGTLPAPNHGYWSKEVLFRIVQDDRQLLWARSSVKRKRLIKEPQANARTMFRVLSRRT